MAGSYSITTRGALTPTTFLLTNRTHNLRVGRIGDGVGSITSDPPGIDCGLTCATAFDIGEVVTLTAHTEVGSSFGGWEGCDLVVAAAEMTPSCRVTVQALSRVTATFQLNVYSITVTSAPVTGGQVSGGGAYRHGFPVIVAATPNPGYVFVNWTEAGQAVSSSSGTHWSADGVAILNHDVVDALLTVALSHLSEFVFFGAATAPADLGFYLPLVMSGAAQDTLPTATLDGGRRLTSCRSTIPRTPPTMPPTTARRARMPTRRRRRAVISNRLL